MMASRLCTDNSAKKILKAVVDGSKSLSNYSTGEGGSVEIPQLQTHFGEQRWKRVLIILPINGFLIPVIYLPTTTYKRSVCYRLDSRGDGLHRSSAQEEIHPEMVWP